MKTKNQSNSEYSLKVFHPFTFSIPNGKNEAMRLFTMPLRWMDNDIINLKLENPKDVSTIQILNNMLELRKPEDSIVDFLNAFEEECVRKVEKRGSYEITQPDKNNWALMSPSAGTQTNVDTVGRIFRTHYTNLWWMPDNYPLNLDVEKELLTNQKEIKLIDNHYVKSKKDQAEIITAVTNQIVKEAPNCKHKIVVVYDEIRGLIPSGHKTGYVSVVADAFSKHLNINFRNRNISSFMTSQSISGISKGLLRNNVFTKIFLGAISGDADLDNLRQIYGFSGNDIKKISQLKHYQFLVFGLEDMSTQNQLDNEDFFISPEPSYLHKEPHHKSWESLYRKYYPEKLTDYSQLKREMKQYLNAEIDKHMKQKEDKKKAEEEKQRLDQEAKEKRAELQEEVKGLHQTIKLTKEEEKQKEKEEIFRLYESGMKQYEIAQKFGCKQARISKIISKLRGVKENEGSQTVKSNPQG